MKRSINLYLQDILDSIEKIEKFIGEKTEEDFFEDEQLQDAVIRNLEIIGEATKNVSLDLKKRHLDIPWKEISGMRDVLTHAYFGVNLERTWKAVKEDLPNLKEKIKKILNNIKE